MKQTFGQVEFWYIYGSLLHRLLQSPIELNERTGVRVRVVPGAVSFGLDLGDRIMPTCGLRKTFPRVAAAEIAWYLSGEQDATWMSQHAPIWDKFIEPLERMRINDLGQPFMESFPGVSSAYGYRWRHHFERDQIALAIQALQADPSNRRVMVSAWDPSEDGLGAPGQKNVPCPAMFTLHIVDNKLHSTMLLRSSDVFVGLPYDVLGHALLMDALANELGVELGIAHFTLAHAHLYESHWEMAQTCLAQAPVVPEQYMPGWTIRAIEQDRDAYVERIKAASKDFTWPTYAPRPEVIV
jgi:thymidylate synthase